MLDANTDDRKARHAVETLEGNGWAYRRGKWIPPHEKEDEDRIIAARVNWLGLVLHPVVVSYEYDGGHHMECRTIRATWTSKGGEPMQAYCTRRVHPWSLRDSLEPDKLRHFHDNAARNIVTKQALEDYYREE